MPLLSILTLVFAGTFALVILALAATRRLRDGVDLAAGSESLSPLLREEAVSSIRVLAGLLARFQFSDVIRLRTREAALDWSVGRIIAMVLLSGTIAFAACSRLSWMPGFATAGITLLVAGGPYFFILRRRTKRLRSFEAQFPDALDAVARALRAGHPFSAGLEMLSAEHPAPLGHEMRRTFEEWKLGSSWDDALANLASRVPLASVSVFAGAVKLQNKTGGRLNEVLAKLAESLRDAVALEDEIRAISAHGRMTGYVLTFLPLFIAGMMMFVSPSYLAPLIEHPYGKNLIAAAAGCLVAAHFIIRKLVDIKL